MADSSAQSLPKKRLISDGKAWKTKETLSGLAVNTVCENSLCPNLNECFSRQTATFLILGKICTRGCSFCSSLKGAPGEVGLLEPAQIVRTVKELEIKYVVITSVTRDDLDDGGASQYVNVINAIRSSCSGVNIEVLVPDFLGKAAALEYVLGKEPDVFAHNVETVPRLYPAVRSGSDYFRSLEVLRSTKRAHPAQLVKSGIMLGLGEERNEVISVVEEIANTGCDILTIGQYLRPAPNNYAVRSYVSDEDFNRYKMIAEKAGFKAVLSGYFIRSSYMAFDTFKGLISN